MVFCFLYFAFTCLHYEVINYFISTWLKMWDNRQRWSKFKWSWENFNAPFSFCISMIAFVYMHLSIFQPSNESTEFLVQCMCNHLTFFGSNFFVKPNKLDISGSILKFPQLAKYPALLATICVIGGSYLIAMIWAVRRDRKQSHTVSWNYFHFSICFHKYLYNFNITTSVAKLVYNWKLEKNYCMLTVSAINVVSLQPLWYVNCVKADHVEFQRKQKHFCEISNFIAPIVFNPFFENYWLLEQFDFHYKVFKKTANAWKEWMM